MKIDIGRHANVDHLKSWELREVDIYPDLDLTPIGRINSNCQALILWAKRYTHLITSPTLRPRRTIEPLAHILRIEPIIMEEFSCMRIVNPKKFAPYLESQERIDQGETGLTSWPEAYHTMEDIGLENLTDLLERKQKGFARIKQELPKDAKPFLQAHGETIIIARHLLKGMPFNADLWDLSMPFCHVELFQL